MHQYINTERGSTRPEHKVGAQIRSYPCKSVNGCRIGLISMWRPGTGTEVKYKTGPFFRLLDPISHLIILSSLTFIFHLSSFIFHLSPFILVPCGGIDNHLFIFTFALIFASPKYSSFQICLRNFPNCTLQQYKNNSSRLTSSNLQQHLQVSTQSTFK